MRSIVILALALLGAVTTPSAGQSGTRESTVESVPVFRLRTGSRGSPAAEEGESRGSRPALTSEQKLNLVKVVAAAVTAAEAPMRLTASRTRVPNRASLMLAGGELFASAKPEAEGHIFVPPNGSLSIYLWFPPVGKPHLVDCLVAPRQPGLPLSVLLEVGGQGQTQTPIPSGWHHVTALLIPEKPLVYKVNLKSAPTKGLLQNAMDLRYCEITPFK